MTTTMATMGDNNNNNNDCFWLARSCAWLGKYLGGGVLAEAIPSS